MLKTAANLAANILVVLALFVGLAAQGANDAVRAPLFAMVLLILAGGAILAERRSASILAKHVWTLGVAALFLGWTLIGLLPAPEGIAHPAWAEFGLERGYLSIAPHRALEGAAQFACAGAAFVLGLLVSADRARRDALGVTLMVAATGYAAWALVDTFVHRSSEAERLSANLGSANTASLVFAVLAIFAIATASRTWTVKQGAASVGALGRAFGFFSAAVALILSILCLYLTASRWGLVAGAAGLASITAGLVYLVQIKARWWLAGVAAAIGAVAIIGSGLAFERFASIENDAINRQLVHEAHWRIFLERPLLGHGVNTFHELNAHYANGDNYAALSAVGSVHQIYIQALEEGGVVGFVLLALCLLLPLSSAARTVLTRGSGAEWALAALAASATVFVQGWYDFGLQTPAVAALFAFLLGAFGASARHVK